MTREPIYAKVLSELGKMLSPPYSLVVPVISRDFQHWADAAEQPAVYVVPNGESSEAKPGLPLKWSLSVSVWVYAKKNGAVLGVQALNPILDAIESLFAPSSLPAPANAYYNTLGGLVKRCSVSGPIEISGGYLGDQSVALLHLEIIVA